VGTWPTLACSEPSSQVDIDIKGTMTVTQGYEEKSHSGLQDFAPSCLHKAMSSQAVAVFVLSRHWMMQLMPLVASVHTYHKCLQHNTTCRAQQPAAVVAAHDGPCAMIVPQPASKNATEFLARCFACTVFQIMCLIHQH